jgi:hypothetical protein
MAFALHPVSDVETARQCLAAIPGCPPSLDPSPAMAAGNIFVAFTAGNTFGGVWMLTPTAPNTLELHTALHPAVSRKTALEAFKGLTTKLHAAGVQRLTTQTPGMAERILARAAGFHPSPEKPSCQSLEL